MPYNIHHADGTPFTVPDNVIDTSFYDPNANGSGKGRGIQLLGRNVVSYGASTAQNFLQLMGNFAGPTPPADARSIIGQLWYNTSNQTMYVRFNDVPGGGITNWKPLGSGGTTPGGPKIGKPVPGTILVDSGGATIGHMAAAVPSDGDASAYIQLYDAAGALIPGVILSNIISAADAAAVGMSVSLNEVGGALIGYAFP